MRASPSKKSVLRLKAKVYDLLRPQEVGRWPEVRDRLNLLLCGWAGYFAYGQLTEAYRAVDGYVCARVQQFLARRKKLPNRGVGRSPLGMESFAPFRPRFALGTGRGTVLW